jgi:hypothetical protein
MYTFSNNTRGIDTIKKYLSYLAFDIKHQFEFTKCVDNKMERETDLIKKATSN